MTQPLFDLDGRIALLTGGSGYLGKAFGQALGEAGALIYLVGRTEATLEEAAADLTNKKYTVKPIVCDVTDDGAIKRLIDRIDDDQGRLDVIVNNAYAPRAGTIESACAEDFEQSYSVSVTASFKLIQSAHSLLKNAGKMGTASVINIASMYGSVSPDPRIYGELSPNPPFYGPAKAGMLQLTRYLGCHLAPDQIRVNAISPGPFPNSDTVASAPEFIHQLEAKVPLGRIGQPDDLKGALLFLASDASRYVTGINLPVDGGWTAW